MNRLGFLILSILIDNEAFGRLQGMTLKEISETEDFDYKENTIYKQLLQFRSNGYIDYGAKEGHAATYYITDIGREFLRKEKVTT